MKPIALLFVSTLLLLPFALRAETLDGTKSLRCALSEAAECDEAAECSDVTLEQIEMPGAWRVDFAAKQLVSTDGQRTSPIHALETLDAMLVLQGHQNGRGWTLVVERATGHLTATIATVEGAFILAGGCSAE
ncbi:MAG: hypothetical protein ACREI8_06485 [Myxococcota bacterium]